LSSTGTTNVSPTSSSEVACAAKVNDNAVTTSIIGAPQEPDEAS
jgi:hypothetical protein